MNQLLRQSNAEKQLQKNLAWNKEIPSHDICWEKWITNLLMSWSGPWLSPCDQTHAGYFESFLSGLLGAAVFRTLALFPSFNRKIISHSFLLSWHFAKDAKPPWYPVEKCRRGTKVAEANHLPTSYELFTSLQVADWFRILDTYRLLLYDSRILAGLFINLTGEEPQLLAMFGVSCLKSCLLHLINLKKTK